MAFSIQDLKSTLMKTLSLDTLSSRDNMAALLGGMSNLSRFWDQRYHMTGTEIVPNAFLYGLVINDWDRSYRSRNTNISTYDLMIPFQYINKIPDWKKGAQYQDLGSEIIGRFETIPVYSNSMSQEFQLEITYQAEARSDAELKSFWTLEQIERIDKKLKAMVFPSYTKGYGAPPRLMLNIGNIYRSFPLVIKDVTSPNEAPLDIVTGLPMVRKYVLECRSAYPIWQAISGDKVFVSRYGNGVFAYQELTSDYSNIKKRRSTTV